MINPRFGLEFYLAADKFALGKTYTSPEMLDDEAWQYQILLRTDEYYNNNPSSFINKILKRYHHFQVSRLGVALRFYIRRKVFGASLRINHFGNILMRTHEFACSCGIHHGVNIGVNNPADLKLLVSTIGSNVWIGPGAKLSGQITTASGVVFGANAAVNRDVLENSTVVGIPVRIAPYRGTEGVEVAANLHKMRKFFRENPRFEKYNTEQRDLVSIQQRNSQLTPWKFA
jgi:serine O-acetyltransferase